MSGNIEFRSIDEEVLKLLEDCADLKQTLRNISNQVNRMETRVKRAFPVAAKKQQERKKLLSNAIESTLSSSDALAIFDAVVKLVASGNAQEAENMLNSRSAADLFVLAREVGASFAKSKPSAKAIREAIFGKVRESLMLKRHDNRS